MDLTPDDIRAQLWANGAADPRTAIRGETDHMPLTQILRPDRSRNAGQHGNDPDEPTSFLASATSASHTCQAGSIATTACVPPIGGLGLTENNLLKLHT
jgi:hypothetical protein